MNANTPDIARRVEALGPAEAILATLTQHLDHVVHNRPGLVVADAAAAPGVRWTPATWVQEGDDKVVYRLTLERRASERVRVGVLGADGVVRDGRKVVGELRKPGLFPEVATWIYRRIADVWRMDQEFAARWASWAFGQDHRDLKVLLAAFMLVQERAGQPVVEDGRRLFDDDDFRAVGEAMCLVRAKHDLNPKLILRIGDVLALPGVAAVNRALGFGQSGRTPPRGRYYKAVEKWLRHREENPRILEGLVRAGFRTTVQALARRVGYKPGSPRFFEILRWKQTQARDGRRTLAIGAEVARAESWVDMSEAEICQRIVETRPDWKRIVGLLPREVGLTRAVMAAAIDAGSLSDADFVILTPTLEELGLLQVAALRDRWQAALAAAENRRAAHVAQRVTRSDTALALREAADQATKKALEQATRALRVYVVIDKSGSMEGALERAKACLAKFVQGIPLERLHVSVFNTVGREVVIKAASAAGVDQALRGHAAGGGTSYAEGVRALANRGPRADEDALIIFVGDQADAADDMLVRAVQETGLRPAAFGLLEVVGNGGRGDVVASAARKLGIPCFHIDVEMFADAYAVTRTLRHLIAATPVSRGVARVSLVETILGTPILAKPVWA
ncbi:MAG: vWA domain-containing protein [Myxococcota bacterium]